MSAPGHPRGVSKTTHHLHLHVDGPAQFDVRRFAVREAMNEPFAVELEVMSDDHDVDLDALVGSSARFELQRDHEKVRRKWAGIITRCEQVDVDRLSTYQLVIHPRLWLLTQRRQYRVFQQMSDPEVVRAILAEWDIEPTSRIDEGLYLARKYRVQYAETDYAFVSRLLEDSGISFYFEDDETNNQLILDDAPHGGALRDEPIAFEPRPMGELRSDFAHRIEVTRQLRPGRYTQRDVDYRQRPEVPLMASDEVDGLEARFERFHLNYGAFLYAAQAGGETPVADDRGASRVNLEVGERQVARRLAAQRADARRCFFVGNAHDVAPGLVAHFANHPRPELAEGRGWLVLQSLLTGNALGEWTHEAEATAASVAYHPPLRTPKPRTRGIESATVVGPVGEEIHCDEFARIRVQFHWDREGQRDPNASCWIPVNQPWGGAGFGAVNLPRVGQEVLIDFLGEDPDRPVVVGRVYTVTNPVPYALPEHKTVSGIRSETANHPIKQMLQQALTKGIEGVVGAVGEQVGDAIGDAVGDAIGGRLGEMIGDGLGQMASGALSKALDEATNEIGTPESPLGSLIPDMAGMLSRFPNPGGALFSTIADALSSEDDEPGPPVATKAPSRATAAPLHVQSPHTAPVQSDAVAAATSGDAMLGGAGDDVVGGSDTPLPEAPGVGPQPELAETPPLPETPKPEVPMDLRRMNDAMANGFGAYSPTSETQHWLGSEVTMDDTSGGERLYVQAQRNQHIVVKANRRTVVQGTRKTKVGASDLLDVGNQQVVRTGAHRGVDVYGNQEHIVQGNITQVNQSVQVFTAPEGITTSSKSLVLVGEEDLLADCGPVPPEPPAIWKISGLFMKPDFVILDAPKLFLNPGQEALEMALATGEAPESAAETEAQVQMAEAAAKQAAVTEARAAYDDAYRAGDISHVHDPIRSGLHADVDRRFGEDVRVEAWAGFMEDNLAEPYHFYFQPPE